MQKSKIFFFSILAFIAGIGVASFISARSWIILAVMIFLAMLFVIEAFYKTPRFLIFILFFFFLGMLRCNLSFANYKNGILDLCDGKKHKIEAVIIKEPEEKFGYANLTVRAEDLDGNLLVRTDLYPKYKYGDKISVEGKMQIPKNSDDFFWKEYLFRYDVWAESYYPKIKLVESGQGGKIYGAIIKIRQYFYRKIQKSISGVEGEFLSALVLGYKGGISEFWKGVFSKTGTSHIIAISGLHISIISAMLLFALLWIGISRKMAFWIISAGLVFYIILIGCSASAVRAGIMGLLVLFAVYAGRLSYPRNILAFAAAAMLAANPLLFRYDAGFQLSFLSIIGIFYLWPVLEKWTEKFPNPLKLKSAFSLSLSAQIATAPLVVYYFKSFALITPFANLIIVPLIPIVISLAVIPFISIFLPAHFLRFLFFPIKILLVFILCLLRWFLRLNNIGVLIIFIVLFCGCAIINLKSYFLKNK